MTQKQFDQSTAQLLKEFARKVARMVDNPTKEKALRRKLKEDHGLIFVREHTVPAYFRPAKQPKMPKGLKPLDLH